MPSVALVCGASSGLGSAVAQRLARAGWVTYAGGRSFARGVAAPEGCLPLALNALDDASCLEAVDTVLREQGRIDALICCQAILSLGAVEETTPETLARVLETCVGGTLRMARAVLPHMRAQGSGRIVLFSSLNGRFAVPFQGAYTAAKHAIEGLAQALRMETRRFGISVTVMEPGDCRGGSDAYRERAPLAESADSPYLTFYQSATKRIHNDEANGLPQSKVADAVLSVLTKKRPPARRVVAQLPQRAALILYGILPPSLFFRALEVYYGIVKAPLQKECSDDER